jgi:digeranylgeranylglycerophospholipid reductase
MGLSLMVYDLIVIGAGPAGSSTAKAVAEAGFRVLILEKNATCRSPCAGYISNTINFEIPDESVIQSKIWKMRTYFPDLSFYDFELNGFVVDRAKFDTALAQEAANSGAEIRMNSPFTGFVPGGVKFRGGEVHGKIILGADGVFSKTASVLGEKRQEIALCAQYHMRNIKPLPNTCEIFFNSDYAPGGYIWVYPTGVDSAKIGVGITGRSPREYLDAFVRDFKRIRGEKMEYVTGALPIGGLREQLCFGNVLFAGDSAGMADPITGAGINNAILAGNIAGKTIIKALESDDLTVLLEYETGIKRLLGRPLGRSLEKRKKLDACCTNEHLQRHLPELWVTFKQYWE